MTKMRTPFDHLTPPSLRDGQRPYVLETARFGQRPDEIKRRLDRNPDTCLPETLPLLIVENSLEEFFEPGLSERAQRALIKAAPRLHQIKGTRPGIRYALDTLGVYAQFVDWFEASPEAPPGTHEITAYVGEQLFPEEHILGPKAIRQVERLIREMKRWSQKSTIRIGVNMHNQLSVASAAAPLELARGTARATRPTSFNRPLALTPAAAPLEVARARGTAKRPSQFATRFAITSGVTLLEVTRVSAKAA